MKKRKPIILENVEIVDAGAEGKAIARVNDKVVFVPYAVPGDVVDIRVTKKRKKYMEGKILSFHKHSDKKITPFCSHFGVCGGCKWQHMSYEDQLYYKQKQVKDNLERIGGIDASNMLPIIGAEQEKYYRNKLDFSFSSKRWIHDGEPSYDDDAPEVKGLGFHIPGFFDKIEDIKHCYLMKDPMNDIRLSVKQFAIENNISFYDYRTNEGYLRGLVIRCSITNDWMINLVIHSEDTTAGEKVLQHLIDTFPQITSAFYTVNMKLNDSFNDLEATHYYGKEWMTEKMDDLIFHVGPLSFYQTNHEQAYKLYKKTKELADLKGDELVYDLYTGTGTIALFVSDKAKKVVGVEYVEEAVIDARKNAKLNGVEDITFIAGDMAKVFNQQFVNEHGKPDVIITDPPRAGMHPDVIQQILDLSPEKIVYVSCNPATQARDIKLLSEKYDVKEIQPVDMFPHTHHVENIALLALKSFKM